MGVSVDGELLTRCEVAKRLRCSVRTLDRIVADGELVAASFRGGRVLFQLKDVDRFILRTFADGRR